MKKILLAGPGTGKTTKVKKEFLSKIEDMSKVLVLSFTNATIGDLRSSFEKSEIAITEKNCLTLHAYALRLSHQENLHVLNQREEFVVKKYAKLLEVDFGLYCEMLNCVTYGQMITNIVQFSATNPVYLDEIIGEIELLIIDEFQDFNDSEQALIELISGRATDTIILGDDDQCIYDFKDANSTEIIRLHNDGEVENIEHENICYRCPDPVVNACKNLLSKNKQRVTKDWNPNGVEGTVTFEQVSTFDETNQKVFELIQATREADPESTILVLSPIKDAVEGLISKLTENAVDFVDFFNKGFDVDLYRKVWALRLIYSDHKLLDFILLVEFSDLNNYQRGKFREMLRKHIGSGFTYDAIRPDMDNFLDTDLVSLLENPPDFETLISTEGWEDIKEILDDITGNTTAERLNKMSQHITPSTTFDPSAVNIMSIHKSKGLEASHVFIVGMVDGVLPRKRDGVDSIESQRRLFFVGMSRAMKELYLFATVKWDGSQIHKLEASKFTRTHPRSRVYNGQASPFIAELGL